MSKAAELAKIGEAITSGQIGGRRNLVINGAMQVNQRGTTDAVNGNGFPVDRFKCTVAALDQLVVALSQDSSAPAGFANSLKIEISTVEDALAVNETFVLETRLESQDLLQVQKGTATAKTMSLTFYVKSSVTGNYALQALDSDNGRSVAFLYAISVADTWEKKSILIPADTTGAFADDNGIGLSLVWFLAAGTNFTSGTLQSAWAGTTNANLAVGHNVNIMADDDNNWSLTGVQLEVGSTATPFEHRSFGEEEYLCKRYFTKHKATAPFERFALGTNVTTDDAAFLFKFYPAMRDIPSLTIGTLSHLCVTDADGSNEAIGTAPVIDTAADSTLGVIVYCADIAGDTLTAGEASYLAAADNVYAFLAFDSEL